VVLFEIEAKERGQERAWTDDSSNSNSNSISNNKKKQRKKPRYNNT
jgi:hypothetical protein